MDLLKYSEKEILYMTPRKFSIMMETYRDFHGIHETGSSDIDNLP